MERQLENGYLETAQVCNLLGIHRSTLWRLVREGRLRQYTVPWSKHPRYRAEEVRALKADLLEALRRLEEGVGEEAPKEAEDEPNLEPDYLTVHVETDGGPMALRRVVFPGAPDLQEFTLPSGSVYEFPFRQVVKTLRPILL